MQERFMMKSTSLALSADDQNKLVTLLAALPDQQAQVSLPDCSTYATYRPILQAALPLIQKIPLIGSKIGTALSFLMSLADSVCNISTSEATPAGNNGAGSITIEKTGQNQVQVTFPQGTKINTQEISEADLFFALSRDLVKAPTSGGTANCILVICPID